MSTLQVNNTQPYSGDTLHLSSSITYISGALSVGTAITSSGDLRFPNIGNGVVNPVANISASGTSSLDSLGFSTTNGTVFLNYGVNVISYANADNYCVKLPQIPNKGKEVTLINLSGIPIHIFPGVSGGSINGITNSSTTLPSDGIAYKFVCWENPLPGGWSIVSPPTPSGVVQSDVIGGILVTQSLAPNQFFYQAIGIISNNIYVTGGIGIGQNIDSYNILNRPLHDAYLGSTVFGNQYVTYAYTNVSQLPSTAWKKINSIKVYTNLSSSIGSYLSINYSADARLDFYQQGTTIHADPQFLNSSVAETLITNIYTPFANSINTSGFWQGGLILNSLGTTAFSTPGTLVPLNPGYVPLSAYDFTGNLSANPGDPGTTYYQLDLNANPYFNNSQPYMFLGKGAGMTLLGAIPNGLVYDPIAEDYSLITLDMYYVSNFGVFLEHNQNAYINGLKVKIVIDYESL
jgi:hypothetical protein